MKQMIPVFLSYDLEGTTYTTPVEVLVGDLPHIKTWAARIGARAEEPLDPELPPMESAE